uniref:Malate dehydrogenase n=1 Tax=Anoplophora glabripennis TaxID=217634 RepID=V5G4E3_ANOGL
MASTSIKMVARGSCQFCLNACEILTKRAAVVHMRRTMASSSTRTAPSQKAETSQLVTTIEEARRFMVDCFKAAGTPQEHAETVTDNLLEADYRGHYSHGMNRLEMYIRDIQGGVCDPKATCTLDKETVATALVNGNNGLGAVVGKYCMDLAIAKAKDAGIAMVVAHGSNHYGIAGIYSIQAINHGLLGMSFTNTSPFMAPTRATQAALGTNPLSLGAPALNGDSFVLDMATTAVAVGKIELARRKGTPIPEGWALNHEGKVETDPDVAYKAAKLMPVGGTEINSGYKGYGLGMLVEIFCGILSGAKYGPFVRKWGAHSEVADLGQAFIAINPRPLLMVSRIECPT